MKRNKNEVSIKGGILRFAQYETIPYSGYTMYKHINRDMQENYADQQKYSKALKKKKILSAAFWTDTEILCK